jgi:LysM repeat protein
MISFPDRSILLAVFLLLFFAGISAQEPVPVERSNDKVILEGKVYYIHVVKPGQTLYSIAKAYNVSQKEITIENPSTVSGLRIGQALKIPVEATMSREVDTAVLPPQDSRKVHVVREGETLYSISRLYETNVESLLKINPELDPEDIPTGYNLVIPQKGVKPSAYNEEGFVFHRVKRRETLYSISRFYHVEVEEIRQANPELGWGGPKTGQTIRIPKPQITGKPETIPENLPVDTLFGIEPDSIQEEYFYEDLRFTHEDRDRTYNIAYLVPFDFRNSEPLDSLLKDVRSESRRNRIIERFRMEQATPASVNFLEFFQGSLLAIDSLRQTGMKLDVRFFDTGKSTARTGQILQDRFLRRADLIIGPFFPFNLELVAEFGREQRIPVVTPFHTELNLLTSNPYLFQVTPSMETEYGMAARLVASKHEYNIVYVRDEDSLGIEKHEYFKELIFDGFDDYHPAEPVIFKELVLQLDRTDEIIHSLSKDKKNLVVVPTRNEALASRVVSSLYYQLKGYDIEILGNSYWTEFSSIDYRYYHDLRLIFYNSSWMDYSNPDLERFLARYRKAFYQEPQQLTRKGINYGLSGYEISLYFLNGLRFYGSRFILSLDRYHPQGVPHRFDFYRVTNYGGYENRAIIFYQFTPDMEIRPIMVPEGPVRHFKFRPLEDRRRPYPDLNLDWSPDEK